MPILSGRQPPVPQPPPAGGGLPQFIVEAGLVPAPPVDTPGTFILSDPVNGRLDISLLGAATIWFDISAYVLAFTITRPSTRLQGPLFQFQAGTCSITIDNTSGIFDPDNLSGPFSTGAGSQLIPMVPVRVRALWAGTTYPLFSGFADGWLEAAVTYEAGYSEFTLPATDAFKILAGRTLPALSSPVGAGETTGARITRILNSAGWYTSASRRTIAAGDSTVQATSFGDTALNLMQLTSDSEIGFLYTGPSGEVVFRNRKALLAQPVQAVFGDLPSTASGELPYAAVSRADDDTLLTSDVQATNVGGVLQEVTNPAAITRFLFVRTYARSDLILQADVAALNWAQYVLAVSRGGEDRFDTLTVDPLAQPADLWPQVLGRGFGDQIQVTKRPPTVSGTSGFGATYPPLYGTVSVTKTAFITGLAHTFDARTSAWSTTWTLADSSRYQFFVLNDPVNGRLNTSALSF